MGTLGKVRNFGKSNQSILNLKWTLEKVETLDFVWEFCFFVLSFEIWVSEEPTVTLKRQKEKEMWNKIVGFHLTIDLFFSFFLIYLLKKRGERREGTFFFSFQNGIFFYVTMLIGFVSSPLSFFIHSLKNNVFFFLFLLIRKFKYFLNEGKKFEL